MRRHMTRSGAIAIVALVAALATGSYATAALLLPTGSVGTSQLRRGAVTAVKLAPGAVAARAVRRGSLLRGDLAPGATAGPAGRVGRTGALGPQGVAGLPGRAGAPGAAGPAGPKGATGDAGTAPPPSFETAGSFGNVAVAANDVGTGIVICPKGLRALSGGPSGLTIGSPPRLTVISSEPNGDGTGWIVTMKAGDVASNFQVEVVCAAVN